VQQRRHPPVHCRIGRGRARACCCAARRTAAGRGGGAPWGGLAVRRPGWRAAGSDWPAAAWATAKDLDRRVRTGACAFLRTQLRLDSAPPPTLAWRLTLLARASCRPQPLSLTQSASSLLDCSSARASPNRRSASRRAVASSCGVKGAAAELGSPPPLFFFFCRCGAGGRGGHVEERHRMPWCSNRGDMDLVVPTRPRRSRARAASQRDAADVRAPSSSSSWPPWGPRRSLHHRQCYPPLRLCRRRLPHGSQRRPLPRLSWVLSWAAPPPAPPSLGYV
jgi:hypothetical protein